MNDYQNQPAIADLQGLLESSNCFDAAWNLDLQGALDSAIPQWKQDTEYNPFLSTGQTITRTFPAPRNSRVLFLQTGLIELTTLSVRAYPGAELQELTLGVDFVLEPVGASDEDRPFTRVRFLRSVSGEVVIEGVFGYALQYPPNAFRAVVRRAALDLAPEIALRLRRDAETAANQLKAKETGPVRLEYQTQAAEKVTNFEAQISAWSSFYQRQVNFYQLV
ncbi:MAG TPA: hypothetical protein VGB77_04885 [Abditibacteriaceae bacterium]|jgi:hypothetical protein